MPKYLPCFESAKRPASFSERWQTDPRRAFEEFFLCFFCCNEQAHTSVKQGAQASFAEFLCCFSCCFAPDRKNSYRPSF